MRAAFGELCRRQGGRYEGNFCSVTEDRERVLFMAKITRFNDGCAQVEALVLVPKGSPDAAAYRERLNREGFESNLALKARQDIDAQRRLAMSLRQDQVRATEARRLAFELPQMRRRGASVCRQDGGITFLAYVEDFTDDKLRVLVSNAYFTQTPSMSPGGFQQHTEWVNPGNWYTCEISPNR